MIGIKEFELALAVHPLAECYVNLPAKEPMQRILDEHFPNAYTLKSSNFLERLNDRKGELYVTAKHSIRSPEPPFVQKTGWDILNPNDLRIPKNTNRLNIWLLGGEAPGCHSGATKILCAWFLNSQNLNELTIRFPYEAIFSGDGAYNNREELPITYDSFVKVRGCYQIKGAETMFGGNMVEIRTRK